jgi:preprotein translocase subunit SecF
MGALDSLKTNYEKHSTKLMIIPIIMIILAAVFLINAKVQTGELIQKDVSLSGGITLTLYTDQEIDAINLEKELEKELSEVVVRQLSEFGTEKQIGVVVETSDTDEEKLKSSITSLTGVEITDENTSIEVVGSSLGESFYNQMVKALIFAFLFMSIAVLITFRKLLPSFAVVIVAIGDIAITAAILNIIGMKISSAGIAALLLLIGYSIDTDVLLTTRILRRTQGKVFDGVFSSIKTGLTMTTTTIAAVLVAYLISSSLVLKQMFLIILIGLVVDIILTYLLNAPMLALYAKKKEGRGE